MTEPQQAAPGGKGGGWKWGCDAPSVRELTVPKMNIYRNPSVKQFPGVQGPGERERERDSRAANRGRRLALVPKAALRSSPLGQQPARRVEAALGKAAREMDSKSQQLAWNPGVRGRV